MKKALVTGGCGFIGSNLSKELVKQGWQVDIVDDMSNGHEELVSGLDCRYLPSASFLRVYNDLMTSGNNRRQQDVVVIQDDFANKFILDYIKSGAYDVVFHQAAIPRVSYSVEQPGETTDTNIGKTVHLFSACIVGNVDRIVFASSSSVYGGADELPTSETATKNPKSPYAWQKSAIEDLAKMCYDLYDLDIVCLRYFNVFGPGQYGDSPYSTAVSAWCHATKNSLECRSDGDGTQTRDMCYIDNIVSANILAANHDKDFKGDFFNIACGDRVSNNEILDYFIRSFESKVISAPTRPGDVKHTQADITKAESTFGYKPLITFWDGLETTVKWWGLK
mgnify:CR=1 FL=1